MQMTVFETASPRLVRIGLVGRLDTSGVALIRRRFHANTCLKAKSALVDLSEVEFLDSMGVRLLVSTARTLDRSGARLFLMAPQTLVEETIRDTALDQIIEVVHSEEEALVRVEPGA